jgi:hypothetical protein
LVTDQIASRRMGKTNAVDAAQRALNLAERARRASWVVYVNPDEYPGECLARLFKNLGPTDVVIRGDCLGRVRVMLALNYPGLQCFPRPNDKFIPEVWY